MAAREVVTLGSVNAENAVEEIHLIFRQPRRGAREKTQRNGPPADTFSGLGRRQRNSMDRGD